MCVLCVFFFFTEIFSTLKTVYIQTHFLTSQPSLEIVCGFAFEKNENKRRSSLKSPKIDFLGKIVNILEEDANIKIDLKLEKVVAGKETEKTRIFLQQFCSSKRPDASEEEEEEEALFGGK